MDNPAPTFPHFATNLDLEYFEDGSGSAEFPATIKLDDMPERDLTSDTLPIPFIPTACLAWWRPHGKLKSWRISPADAAAEAMTPIHIIGGVVVVAKGRTSPIESIDPATRRIRTTSGSVYELGEPDHDFRQHSPEVVRCLGF